MSGLLRKLQKSASKDRSTIADVLIAPMQSLPSEPGRAIISEDTRTENFADGELLSADSLLEEVMADAIKMAGKSDKSKKGSKNERLGQGGLDESTSRARIVRRQRKSSELDGQKGVNDQPPWLSFHRRTNPQIDTLVSATCAELNLEIMKLPEDESSCIAAVNRTILSVVSQIRDKFRITKRDEEFAAKEIIGLVLGKGPLHYLYEDQWVTDVFIDSHESVKVIRRGQSMSTPFGFRSADEYRFFVNAMLKSAGCVIGSEESLFDCVLNDKWRSRVSVVDSSVLEGDEPRVVIKVPRSQQVTFYEVLQGKVLPATVAAWLTEVVISGQANILILGPSGSGKTLLTTSLLSCVPTNERVITVEEMPEISVPSVQVEKLVTRPADSHGEHGVSTAELLRAALRRAPNRIIVGELTDEAVRLYLKALETGHMGSMATIHAENAIDALWRMLDGVSCYEQGPQESLIRRISRSIHLLITMRKVDGKPCLWEISEVLTPVQGEFVVQSLIRFEGSVYGKRQWRISVSTSRWIAAMENRGVELKPGPNLLAPDS